MYREMLNLWSRKLVLPATAVLAVAPCFAQTQNPPDRGSVSLLDRVSSAPVPDPDKRVIAEGQPALTEGMSTRYINCLAWLLELDFTPSQRAKLRAMLIDDWQQAKAADIKSDLEVLELESQASKLKPDERDLARRKIQPELIKALGADKANENCRWLLNVYNEANQPIAGGNPPLTRKVSDSFAELFCFILAEAGGKQMAADSQFKEAWSKLMIQKYPGFKKEQQAQFVQIQELWPTLRVAWTRASDADKDQLRAQWKQMLQNALPKDPVIAAAERATIDLAALAKRDRNCLTPAELRKGANDLDLVAAGLRKEGGENNLATARQAEQTAQQFRAAAQNAVAAQSQPALTESQRRLRSEQAYAQAMSRLQSSHSSFVTMMNMNTMSHVANMNMIATMGGSPYRYEVKYR